MKKKFSLWLNIATICLCVCAVAIGVYAAQSATLTVSGSVGFTAHDLGYSVESATIQGYLTNPDDSTTYKGTPQTLTCNDGTILLPKGTNNAIYFSDLNGEGVQDIVIKLKLKNTSKFPIEATLSLPQTDTIQNNIKFSVEQGVAQMGTSGETQTQEMIITMSLKNPTTNTGFSVTDLSFNVNLVKYQKVKYDTTGNYYYVTMGSNVVTDTTTSKQQVKPVKWIPFAKHVGTSTTGADENGYIAFSKTEKPVEGGKYYFLSENILDLGLDTASKYEQYGVSYNNTYTCDSTASKYMDTEYSDLYANNYLASNVRALLKGQEVYDYYTYDSTNNKYNVGGQKVDLLKEYGIQGYTYASITARTAENLYEPATDDKAYTAMTNASYDPLKGSDSLWLLSGTELKLFLNDASFDYESYPSEEDLVTTTFRGEVGGSWWLRSPRSDYGLNAWCVSSSGLVSNTSVYNALGIRPAFTLTI